MPDISCNAFFFALTNCRHTKHFRIYEKELSDAVCLFLVVMSGCGNKEQSSQQAEPVKVDLGSRVRQGQLLATLDEVSMQNTYQAAKAALKQAEDAYQRMKELHEKGSLAEMK